MLALSQKYSRCLMSLTWGGTRAASATRAASRIRRGSGGVARAQSQSPCHDRTQRPQPLDMAAPEGHLAERGQQVQHCRHPLSCSRHAWGTQRCRQSQVAAITRCQQPSEEAQRPCAHPPPSHAAQGPVAAPPQCREALRPQPLEQVAREDRLAAHGQQAQHRRPPLSCSPRASGRL